MTTYTLTARNGESPSITFEVSAPFHWAMGMVKIAEKAFRDIQVINNETGEVMLTKYQSSEVFGKGQLSIPYALMQLEVMCADMPTRIK